MFMINMELSKNDEVQSGTLREMGQVLKEVTQGLRKNSFFCDIFVFSFCDIFIFFRDFRIFFLRNFRIFFEIFVFFASLPRDFRIFFPRSFFARFS